MKLKLKRIHKSEDYTIGCLYIENEFFCNTLEDKVRDLNNDGDLLDEGENKVYGKTAIPAGTYEVRLTYSNRFKKVLPLLIDVPHFEGIRIHAGNTAEDTEGCILLGINSEKGKVLNSRPYVNRLIDVLSFCKEKIEITIE